MRGYVYTSQQVNPYVNLAIEEYLLGLGAPCLYLWQNGPSVIIGRNQNAYTECDLSFANDNGILVARRNTGGGAVYHDLGNINFSIILPRRQHDITRSTGMIVRSLQSLGIDAHASGRNDILINDQKVSGNAYYSNEHDGLHHGTILYAVDLNTLSRVLAVPAEKTSRHGIASVKSRVTDITSHYPAISIPDILEAIRSAFCAEYGLDTLDKPHIKATELDALVERYSSHAWIYDRINEYDVAREGHFGWGSARVSVLFAGTAAIRAEVTSDSLDPDLIDEARRALNRPEGSSRGATPLMFPQANRTQMQLYSLEHQETVRKRGPVGEYPPVVYENKLLSCNSFRTTGGYSPTGQMQLYSLEHQGGGPLTAPASSAHNPVIDDILNIYREITSEGACHDQ